VKLSETVSIDLNVNFDSNSDVVKPAYYGEIGRVAEFLQQYVGTSVVIEGHTDTSGSASYNKNLSQRRADSVAAVLVQQMGVSQARVSAMGYGEEQPIADESTATGREANRRVVAKVSAKVESMEEK
jgi:Outer membrane protein and related peptidoglycan-associated (lipo)proteins